MRIASDLLEWSEQTHRQRNYIKITSVGGYMSYSVAWQGASHYTYSDVNLCVITLLPGLEDWEVIALSTCQGFALSV